MGCIIVVFNHLWEHIRPLCVLVIEKLLGDDSFSPLALESITHGDNSTVWLEYGIIVTKYFLKVLVLVMVNFLDAASLSLIIITNAFLLNSCNAELLKNFLMAGVVSLYGLLFIGYPKFSF